MGMGPPCGRLLGEHLDLLWLYDADITISTAIPSTMLVVDLKSVVSPNSYQVLVIPIIPIHFFRCF